MDLWNFINIYEIIITDEIMIYEWMYIFVAVHHLESIKKAKNKKK